MIVKYKYWGDAAPLTAQPLHNPVNIFASREDKLVEVPGIKATRTYYCQKTDKNLMAWLNASKIAM